MEIKAKLDFISNLFNLYFYKGFYLLNLYLFWGKFNSFFCIITI